jgi:putative transposase
MIYLLIAENRRHLSVTRMCELLEISSSAFYAWDNNGFVKSDDSALVDDIKKIKKTFKGYGYRRVTRHLKRKGLSINHKRVQRIMKKHGLLAKKKRRFVKTTDSTHGLPVYPNLAKNMILTGIDQLWISDLTYIRLKYEFIYLAVILDAFSRKVIGWALREYLHRELCLAALRMAILKRDPRPGITHHSDRGVQYASGDYVSLLSNNGFVVSMSRSGNPYDNAKAESFMATLKKEEVSLTEYKDFADAINRIGYFIEDVYNSKRLHSSLGYLPPAEFEANRQSSLCLI